MQNFLHQVPLRHKGHNLSTMKYMLSYELTLIVPLLQMELLGHW